MTQLASEHRALMIGHQRRQRLFEASCLSRSLPLANCANCSGSSTPLTIASSMARPLTPSMSVATDESLTLPPSTF